MNTMHRIYLIAFLFMFPLLPASTHADDAALKKQLVGLWRGPYPDNRTMVLKENGIMTSSDTRLSKRWEVRDGVFHTKLADNEDEDFFKIISLTKTTLVIQDMYHGKHTGTYTRIQTSKTKP